MSRLELLFRPKCYHGGLRIERGIVVAETKISLGVVPHTTQQHISIHHFLSSNMHFFIVISRIGEKVALTYI